MSGDAHLRCSWCEASAAPGATHCASCGAALAQREDLGGLLVPGVTGVHPGLADLADRPMRLPGPSSSQGLAPALIVGAALGGPIGAVAIGGVVAVAGAEYLGARRPGMTGPGDLESVGRTSEIARQVAERLDRGEPAAGEVTDQPATGEPTEPPVPPPGG